MALASSVMCMHYESILEYTMKDARSHTCMAQVKQERLKRARQHWRLWACRRKDFTKRILPKSDDPRDIKNKKGKFQSSCLIFAMISMTVELLLICGQEQSGQEALASLQQMLCRPMISCGNSSHM